MIDKMTVEAVAAYALIKSMEEANYDRKQRGALAVLTELYEFLECCSTEEQPYDTVEIDAVLVKLDTIKSVLKLDRIKKELRNEKD